jgi:hypoxanthine phosphoribosyltransferase
LPVNVGAIAAALMIYIKNQMVSFMKHTVEVMIPETEIKARSLSSRQINFYYKDSGSEMVLVGLLRGSFMFMADLCREFRYPMKWIS